MSCHFYCQKLTGDVHFSIDEWNRQFKICNAAGIEMPADDKVGCKDQCFDCMAIVGETRLKNKSKEWLATRKGSTSGE